MPRTHSLNTRTLSCNNRSQEANQTPTPRGHVSPALCPSHRYRVSAPGAGLSSIEKGQVTGAPPRGRSESGGPPPLAEADLRLSLLQSPPPVPPSSPPVCECSAVSLERESSLGPNVTHRFGVLMPTAQLCSPNSRTQRPSVPHTRVEPQRTGTSGSQHRGGNRVGG